MKKTVLGLLILCGFLFNANAQVKIGNNPDSINSNSLLELESATKGFLPPRMALSSLDNISPMTGSVPAGMLVYNTGGSLSTGFYYWNSSQWVKLINGAENVVLKTTSDTLSKTETIVLASNDITLQLPLISAADDGLKMTVKNVGIHTDLVTVTGSGTNTIDGFATSTLTKFAGQAFIAADGNWIIQGPKFLDHVMGIDEDGSWTTIQEAIDFLNLHMHAPVVIRLEDENFDVNSTISIDLPYPITIEGLAYGMSHVSAGNGLAGKPMFRCTSDCNFKMLHFDANTLSGYGTSAGEDCIRFVGSGTYNEIKDCSFDGFFNTILVSSDAKLWLFENDINGANKNGLLIRSGKANVQIKVSETDFINCRRGINLNKGDSATIQLNLGGYYNKSSTDSAIIYNPGEFVNSKSIKITGNSWNNTGTFISGFDFTRTDGRDANDDLESNAGIADQKPFCNINVLNSTTNRTLTTQNVWYKADWGTNTSSRTCKWTIVNNRITYQPENKRNGVFTVSGNLSINSNSQNVSICIVKNGVSTTRYGETTLRVVTSSQPFQFSFLAYIENIAPGDYFEIYYSNGTSSSKIIQIQDIQWLVETK